MNHLHSLLREMTGLLNARREAWALVGGLAVSIRTEPRFTRDIDLAIAVSDDTAAEALIHSLCGAGFQPLATVEQEVTHRLATARLLPAGGQPGGLMLDLLFASSGIESEVCSDAEQLHVFPGVCVPVARIPHLMALKVLARDDRTRPQDALDLRLLISAAHPSDLEKACALAQLIEQRGFNRARNLVEGLSTAWTEFRP